MSKTTKNSMNLPLVLNSADKEFIFVGGGKVATRKIESLAKTGVKIRVISKEISLKIKELSENYNILIEDKAVTPEQTYPLGSWVVLATNNSEFNQVQAKLARDCGAYVCRADDQSDNDFIFPAVVDRSPLLVAISTSGATPALTRHLKQRLEAFIPHEYSKLALWMEQLRARVQALLPESKRPLFWRNWMRSQAADQILARNEEAANKITEQLLEGETPQAGEVFLVGAGPGDPDLLTFRALRLIQMADVVFYDRLVGDRIMDLIPESATRHYVGKARSDHAVPQGDINRLLVEEAQKGHRVLRLKGGDPFIFGRGGEEIEELAEANIPFQIVPGITAASGCASYAGIPLTHREHAQSVRFVTGHLKDNSCNLPWNELIHPNQTLVIYMGLVGLPIICEQLIAHGMPPDTPIALVEKGTRPDQRVHTGTLATMPDYVQGKEIHAPTLTIVGSVVTLHGKLSWF